jgi:ribosome biogenesis GTPase A
VSRFSLPDEDRSFLTEQIGMIRSRRLDPNLYLAIVGEFSSGKSTLINALLGADLLPTGAIPTTSAVTKIHHSPHVSVEFYFRKNCGRPISLCSTAVPVAEIVAFLKTVMMDPGKAADIAEIRVGHPSPFLANGIVVIDTPGFDAPEAGHAEIAKHVVGFIADCAVVWWS